jgi:hypothetical protein
MAGKPGKPGMFCFKGFAEQVLSDHWYCGRANDKLSKEEKVIKHAGCTFNSLSGSRNAI